MDAPPSVLPGHPILRGPVSASPPSPGSRRGGRFSNLIILVRADPIICGHFTEARNLAEAAIADGFEQVHIISYPLDTLEVSGLPLKPLETVLPYSPGITVHRPEPLGDYKILDGRLHLAMAGCIIDLLHQATGPTAVLDLYLVPHGQMVIDAVRSFERTPACPDVTTIGEALGSDITNVVNNALAEGRFGAAQLVLSTYLEHDRPVAVSEYTKQLIVAAGQRVDEQLGTNFANRLTARVDISYPAIDTSAYTSIADRPDDVRAALDARGLTYDGYLLFLSRLAPAKGVDDLIHAYRASRFAGQRKLAICGRGPALDGLKAMAGGDPNIVFFTDVGDDEKGLLMHGATAYVFPSKPRTEFTETFGIAPAEAMLAGGPGPVLTTRTGGIPEAVGGRCLYHEADDVPDLTRQLNALHAMSDDDRRALADTGQAYAMRFDRAAVLANLTASLQASGVA